jgi:flagellar motor component MotA
MKMMLADSLMDLHTAGGSPFMPILSLLLAVNVAILIYVIIARVQHKTISAKWVEAIKQVGLLAAVWGAFSTIIGFFQAFGALEEIKEMLPFQVIMGGMKVALITVLYGLLIYCLSLIAFIILQLTTSKDK